MINDLFYTVIKEGTPFVVTSNYMPRMRARRERRKEEEHRKGEERGERSVGEEREREIDFLIHLTRVFSDDTAVSFRLKRCDCRVAK